MKSIVYCIDSKRMSESKEKEFHTTTSNWSDSIENVIKSIGEQCEGYKWMNLFAARRASFRHSILMYILIFIGPISGTLNSLTTVDENDGSKIINILVTIFSFLTGVVSAIIKFSKYEQKSGSHKNIATKYASLEGNVRRQLSLYRQRRVNAGDYLEWVSKSFDELYNSTPLMPIDIEKRWIEFAKQNGMTIPKSLGETIHVERADIKVLTDVGKIDINEKEEKEIENDKSLPDIKIVMQGPGTMKREKHNRQRSEVYVPRAELNKYNDSAMAYEMRRLFRQ